MIFSVENAVRKDSDGLCTDTDWASEEADGANAEAVEFEPTEEAAAHRLRVEQLGLRGSVACSPLHCRVSGEGDAVPPQ